MRKKFFMEEEAGEVRGCAAPTAAASPPAAYLRNTMDSVRQNKVNSLLQREMAEIFQQEGRNLLPGGLITVSAVRVSPDLGLAKVYLSLFPVKDKQAVIGTIKDQSQRLRGLLGGRIGKQMRVVPELIFYVDDSLDRAEEIEKLLKG
jgi:ribosome-binding factor A